ncbi:hypothetical protein [uncultured Marixanthomonas sp.]|uniref:hypothetical protein n=1 Tax=uncultured Marixanthomonas sp. TaxID=757245 RepID=UPI0030DCE4E2|tara:strand:+ start:53881 stop:54891 length:1011 start_codon:yes stop_codon:yes gene_type:complete
MKKRSFIKDLHTLIPLVFSGLLCIGLTFILWQKTTLLLQFEKQLIDLSPIFIAISGFLSVFILLYLILLTVNLKKDKEIGVSGIEVLNQKMHAFREIIEILLQSKMWLPGLKEYIDEEFSGLTFFQVKEFYKGKSKLAIEFLQEKNNYADTENLYLELKSLVQTDVKQKHIPEIITKPEFYKKDLIQKWLEHKCGSGLWYYFGYKYGAYKDALDLEAIYERHQEKIMMLANSIDSKEFEDSSFNEVFLSKLGEYMTNNVLPKLYQLQEKSSEKLPSISRYLYVIFLVLVFFGVLLPLAYFLFSLSILSLIISYAFVISVVFFISTTFFRFLNNSIN